VKKRTALYATAFSVIGVICLILSSVSAYAAAAITQTFDLHPGWNAIYLEVQPDPKTPADVFGSVPEIDSVWTWIGGNSSIEFIQDPAEGLAGLQGWHVYTASPSEAFLTDLYAIFANRAYLIKVKGAQPVALTVTGTPRFEPVRWQTDSFNLLGFRLDPPSPPTFSNFFSPSSAHYNQAVYRLNSQGKWTFVESPSSAAMRSGEAYWVYCSGGSKYQGPLSLEVTGDNLDFGKIVMIKNLTIRNLSSAAKAVRVVMLDVFPNIFTYKNINTATQRVDWLNLEGMPAVPVAAAGTSYITIGVRREQMSSSRVDTLLAVYDDQGTRILMPMSVEK